VKVGGFVSDREVIVTLVEGTALRGVPSWWSWTGFTTNWRLRDVSALGGDEKLPLSGSMLVPKTSVLTVQVL